MVSVPPGRGTWFTHRVLGSTSSTRNVEPGRPPRCLLNPVAPAANGPSKRISSSRGSQRGKLARSVQVAQTLSRVPESVCPQAIWYRMPSSHDGDTHTTRSARMWQERGAPWGGACIIRPPLLRPCGEREARLRFYRAFAAARLRHYAEASGRLLLRQWQGMLLLGLVVIGQATTIFMLPASGLASLARSLNPVGLFALVLLAVLFVLPQRRALRGGGLEGFARTLPIPTLLRLLVDATVLLLADGLLLLELVLAAAIGGPAALPGLAGILALVLAAQLVALHLLLPAPRRTVRHLA